MIKKIKSKKKINSKGFIIMYHYVSKSLEQNIKLNYLDNEIFKKQINFIEKKGKIINPLDLKQKVYTGKNLLTFDDGYRDHYQNVYPILKKKRIKAIFFLSSQVYEKKEFLDVNKIQLIVNNYNYEGLLPTLELIANKFSKTKIIFSEVLGKNSKRRNRYDAKNIDDFKKLIQFLLPVNISKKSLNTFFYDFLKINHEKLFKNFYLTKDQIIEMRNQGMMFGNHTSTHPFLPNLSYKEQFSEIKKNEEFLNKMNLMKNIKFFSYPYGKFNNITVKILKKLRYDFAFTVNHGYMNIDQPLLLNRIDTNQVKNYFNK